MRKHNKKIKSTRKSNNTNNPISKILSNGSIEDIISSYSTLQVNPSFLKYINNLKIKNPVELYIPKFSYYGLDQNLALLLIILNHQSSKLNTYIKKEKELTRSILNSNWEDAENSIKDIDKDFGYSISYLKLKKALIDDKKISNSINLDKLDTRLFPIALLKHCSDLSGNPDLYEVKRRGLKRNIEKGGMPEYMKQTFLYHTMSLNTSTSYKLDEIIKIEKDTSLIDIYNFVNFYLDLSKIKNNLIPKDFTKILSKNISPEGFDILKWSTPISHSDFNELSTTIYDLYVEDKQNEIVSLYLKNKKLLFDINEILLISKAVAETEKINEEKLTDEIINNLSNILKRGREYKKSKLFLDEISYKYRSLKWFRDLNLFLQSEKDFIDQAEHSNLENLIATRSKPVSSISIPAFNGKLKREAISIIKSLKPNSPSLTYIEILNGEPVRKSRENRLNGYAKGFSKAASEFNKRNFKSSKSLFKSLDNINLAYHSLEVERWLVKSIIALNSPMEAIDIFINRYLTDRDSATKFHLPDIVNSIGDEYKTSKNINYPIIYSIYSEEIDSKFDSRLCYIFELFLDNNNATLPQNLFGMEEQFGKRKLTYFFENICKPENIKLHPELESNADIESTRTEICKYLIKNKLAKDATINEMRELDKSRILNQARKKVDSSRIYVDTSVFYGRDSSPVRALFDSYINQPQPDEFEDQALANIYQTLHSKNKGDIELSSAFHIIYVEEPKLSTKIATLISLLGLVRDEFVHGEKGLNHYLSTRIRHGVLPTALRNIVKDEGIYIDRDDDSNEYKRKFNIKFGDNIQEKAYGHIETFSDSYEDIISLINDTYLQVETMIKPQQKSKNERLFLYNISLLEAYSIHKEMPLLATYDEFISIALKWMWNRTNTNLQKAKDKITTETRLKILELLKFKKKISNLGNSKVNLDIVNAIDRIESNLDSKLQSISSWFNVAENDYDEEYDIECAIEIAKNMFVLDVELNFNNLHIFISGSSFNHFVDIFAILFENSISKSGLDITQIDTEVEFFEKSEDTLTLKVSNMCNPKQIKPENIQFYKDAYGYKELVDEAVQQEGGTGFFKIWNTIEKGLQIEHTLDMKFEGSKFIVLINMKNTEGFRWKKS